MLHKLQNSCYLPGPGSVVGIAIGYGLDGPGIESRWGARFSAPVQTSSGAHPASCTVGTGSFPVMKSGRGVTLTPHPLLVPWSWKSRAIPLLPLWAVRPVQSLSACARVHFTYHILRHFLYYGVKCGYDGRFPRHLRFITYCHSVIGCCVSWVAAGVVKLITYK